MYYVLSIVIYIILTLITISKDKDTISNTTKGIIILVVLPLISLLLSGILCIILGIKITKP